MRKKMILTIAGLFVMAMLQADATTYYVDASRPDDGGAATNWATAKQTIQAAVDLAADNDTVRVTNGVYDTGGAVTPSYACSNRVVIASDIIVQSVNGPEHTFIVGAEAAGGGNGTNAVRGVCMSAGVLSGFTVSNGHTMTIGDGAYDLSGGGINLRGGSGIASNCVLTGNSADRGGGSYYGTLDNCTLTNNSARFGGGSYYGTLNHCTLTDNSARSGGGSYYGTLNNCTLTDNSASYGGGSHSGTLNNCMLTGNSAAIYGGGSNKGTLNNCTLTGNSARYDGGGSARSTINNCIIWANTADAAGDNWYNPASVSYSCTTPDPGGTGNITDDPMLLSASHIHADSSCAGAGSSTYSSGTDIDGDAWAASPSIGCDEPLAPTGGDLAVSISVSCTNVVITHPLAFDAEISGEVASNSWTFGDGTSVSNLYRAEHAWSAPGNYDVVLTAFNDDHPGGISATVKVQVVSVDDSTFYVNAANASPDSPYTNWATAATNIQDAVDQADGVAGCVVWVTNGVYDAGGAVTPGNVCSNRVQITNDITVLSVNGPEYTFIVGEGPLGSNAVRGVYMSAGVLDGFTVTNGHTRIVDSDKWFDLSGSGGGVNLRNGNGIVSNCVLTGNSASWDGGGSFGGTLNNCVLTGNSAESAGGGSRGGMLNNCALTGNSAWRGGGGDGGTLNNCTLTGNSAVNDGGGSYGNTLNNCILWNNTAYGSGDNWQDPLAVSYSCTTPDPGGTGNITNAPLLLSASHIHADSPCVGAGHDAYASGTDIDGETWGSPPSMGCDELDTPFSGNLQVSIGAAHTNVMTGYSLSFVAKITGEVSSNRWTFGDGASVSNSYIAEHIWPASGSYDVVLTAFNGDHPSGVSATVEVQVVSVDDSTFYVDAANASPSTPYMSWGTAATNIQDAVALANGVAGSTVRVTNGFYNTGGAVAPGSLCMNRVLITGDITVRSVNGPEYTFIIGEGPVGTNAVRGVYMSAGTLSGFTVTNGHTRTDTTHYDQDDSGGGVNMYHGDGIVSNCVLVDNSADRGGGSYFGTLTDCTHTGNLASDGGGGSYYGTLTGCTITGNSASDGGGGSYYGTLNNCTLASNSAYRGGGSYYGTLTDCTLTGNLASDGGGGCYNGILTGCTITNNSAYRGAGNCFGTLTNCTLAGNSASDDGGGSYNGTLTDCTLTGNLASDRGGGSYSGTLTDCTLTGNSATYGGGSHYGTLNNCTLSGNSATNYGGGSYWGTLNNCIVYFNTAEISGGNGHGSTFSYSCTTPDPGGTGNITNNPHFVNTASNNFRLSGNSPCINAGANAYATSATDLDGNPRILGGTVDMGAYEFSGLWATPADGLVSSGLEGGPFSPSNRVYAIINLSDVASQSWAADWNASWITVSPSNGTLSADASANVTVSLSAAADSLPPGTYSDTVVFSNLTGDASFSRNVELTVSERMQVTPADGLASFGTKGAFSPSNKVYTVANLSGGTSLSWAAGWNASWIAVSPSGGTLPAGGSTNVTVSLSAAADSLPRGTHTDAVVFSNLGSSASFPRNMEITVFNTYYVDASRPDDSADGRSWAAAKKTIQAAVDLAADGETVFVTNGVYDTGGAVTPGYACSNRVVITNDITVQSVNGAEHALIVGAEPLGDNAVRGVYMSAGVLSGFTVTNGHTRRSGYVYYDLSGGGINLRGGDGVVNNCVLTGNSASVYGGGSYYGTLNNCTLTDNSARFSGGSYYSTLNNCIVYFNTAGISGDNWYDSTPDFSYSCTTPDPGGTGNITSDPLFMDRTNGNFQLQAGSPCVNAGNNADAPAGTDLAGNPRIIAGTVDMGALELQNPDAMLVMPPDGLTASGVEGGPFNPSNRVYAITNLSSGASLSWSVGWSNAWLAVSPLGGTLAAGASTNVTVALTASADSLPPGTYTDAVVFSNLTSGIFFTRNVELTVNEVMQVTPVDGLVISGAEGGPFSPSNKTYTVANLSGRIPLSWAVNRSTAWLAVSPVGGTLAAGASTNVTVALTASADSLSLGTYTDTVVFSNLSSGIFFTRNVELTVNEVMQVTPVDGLVISGAEGGPFNPSNRVYAITNLSVVASLSWSAGWSNAWLAVSSSGGTLAPGSSTNVTVALTASADFLPPGTYSDTVVFSNLSTGVFFTRNVELVVIGLVSLPHTESFETGFGEWRNSTGDDINWRRHSGSTTSSGTGPSGAADGTYYIYTESSSPNYPSKTAAIEAIFDFSGISDPILSFDYHMYGSSMGTLAIDVFDGTWHSNKWSRSGQQHTSSDAAWSNAVVDLSAYGGKEAVTVRLRGVTGSSYASDMAIDHISVYSADDTDGDGLPDDWETTYWPGDLSYGPGDPTANPDYTVWQCYIAGLNPTNPVSAFLAAISAGQIVQWSPSESGRVYSVWWTTNLLDNFQSLETNLPWTQGSYTNPDAPPCSFYKIKVELE